MNAFIKVLLWASYAISLYFAIFLFLQLIKNKYRPSKKKLTTFPKVTITVPAYNEAKTILPTLESLHNLNYPKNKIQIVIVDDGSTDGTEKAVKAYIKNKSHMQYVKKKNGGKGSALNVGLKLAKGEYFSCLDADSEMTPDALRNMVGVFDKDIAIVTPAMRIKEAKTLIQRMQRVEYIIQVLLARLISHLDCQYVAPGPGSVYRTGVLRKLGGFDEGNLTEDQEIGYRHQLHHYRIRHCNEGLVFTKSPATFKEFYKQRNRWYKGGFSNLLQYRKLMFNKNYGDFGVMQMLMNVVRYALCIVALIVTFDIFLLPWLKRLKDLSIIEYDLLPYLEKLTLHLDIASIGILQMLVLTVIFAITLYLFWTAHKEMKEGIISQGVLMFIPYFFLYYLAKSAIVFIVLIEIVVGKKQKW
ncbi:MAG: glycosyltransferase family 2 protein [Candidatus Woesearchaeota archaeon]|jgi:cellulose synthase/poly-beta-1,6-N-acetylglucosamine synthase-like glycosyltransferase|nr:glycosyltransferase family 2 protein [Candidatus Woesearchaeota archaeon]MDP7180922.1 glycosyltransferase family 2 protein [Candidatus Woesearchaeota archaeon]MDP7199141.1 glycosyltransferase family 2 protein [Candidatus Woesearchaeota archaeon]MDP7467596.1 glycosyltransferase family 2 protein [Candidatus Woesearchaeota archaeon]MDP7647078.1 glycosyltransferase family 2 protein [Candidatus Woesearchaeota archaeon]